MGLRYVTTERVLFVDADLVGLRPEHVVAMCVISPLDGQLVGVRGQVDGMPINAPIAVWPSISGERRLPTALGRSLRLRGAGWRVETEINAAVARARLPHRQIVLRGVANPIKKGLGKALREWVQVAGVTVLYAPELARYVWTEQ